ncbi:T9SS type A sorting domain-containing protein [Bacteroidota bacterium]
MKKFLPLLLVLFIANSAFALKEVKVVSTILPEPKIITSGQVTQYEVVIQNSGDENVLETDSIFVVFGLYGASPTIFGVLYTFHALAPNDTCHFSFKFTLNSAQSGTIQLMYMSALTRQIADFKGIYSTYNMVGGLNDEKIEFNKVYYANGNLFLDINNKLNDASELFITNINGQIVHNESMNYTGESHFQVYLGELPAGIYILGIKSNGIISTKKFMIR